MMTYWSKRSEYDDDALWLWCFWSKDQSMMMLFLCWWCFWSKDQSMMMMFLIERLECDDDYDRQIRIWWWWCCYWSKGQGAEDVGVDRKVKVLKMLLIESSKMLKMSLLIEQSNCWRCYWSKGPSAEVCRCKLKYQNAEDVVDDEDWRLHDVENLPMIYRCVTLLMLMMSAISTIVVVDVEYPSH